ncbi:MAG: molybdate ABC transporter permease subunit [Cyanophyceae cyanobacterium]
MTDLTPIWISLKTATTATVITFFLGVMAARWMLGYRGQGQGIIEGVLTAPLVLPPTVVGFLLLLLFGKNGAIGQLLDSVGIRVIFSWYATVIASTVVAFPLMYRTALGAFQQIDANLLACARTLGASEWIVFWRIMFPLAQPGLIAGALLAFARALGEFGATLMLAGAIPGKTETIPIAIFLAAEGGSMNRAWMLVAIMLAISLGVITAVNYGDNHRKLSPKPRRHSWTLPTARLANRAISRNRLQHPDYLPPATIQLIVDIQKQLADFRLDVSFTTDQTPLGLLGASGAGKSTIVRCIAGLDTPDRGKIILNGRVLYDSRRGIDLPPRDRACGFLFQNYALFPHLTVAENIAFGVRKKSRRDIRQEVETHLMAVDLQGMGNRYPGELSGGQQQRVALARAKASHPEMMLLDEPFSALDTYLRDKQEKLLRMSLIRYQGVTLFITHNLEEVYRVCPQLLVVDAGKAIAHGSKQEIFERPPNWRTAQLTGCKNFSRAIAVAQHKIKALDWHCQLAVIEPIPPSLEYVGIRAHQLIFPETDGVNTFPCWLATISETQHRMTLYLKLHQPALYPEDYHLQAEVFKDNWLELKERSFPWLIQLSQLRIMLLKA